MKFSIFGQIVFGFVLCQSMLSMAAGPFDDNLEQSDVTSRSRLIVAKENSQKLIELFLLSQTSDQAMMLHKKVVEIGLSNPSVMAESIALQFEKCIDILIINGQNNRSIDWSIIENALVGLVRFHSVMTTRKSPNAFLTLKVWEILSKVYLYAQQFSEIELRNIQLIESSKTSFTKKDEIKLKNQAIERSRLGIVIRCLELSAELAVVAPENMSRHISKRRAFNESAFPSSHISADVIQEMEEAVRFLTLPLDNLRKARDFMHSGNNPELDEKLFWKLDYLTFLLPRLEVCAQINFSKTKWGILLNDKNSFALRDKYEKNKVIAFEKFRGIGGDLWKGAFTDGHIRRFQNGFNRNLSELFVFRYPTPAAIGNYYSILKARR